MKTLITIMIGVLLFGYTHAQTKSTFRPSVAIYWSKLSSNAEYRNLASHISFEIADIGKFHCAIGLYSFYTEHDYVNSYHSYSYNHFLSNYSSSSTSTTYQCKMKEYNHSATIAMGWNSKYFKNRVHFSFHAGVMVPFYNTYRVSNFSGQRVSSHSYYTTIDGYSGWTKKEELSVTEENMRIAEKFETLYRKFLSTELSFLFNHSFELGFEFMLHSQPIRKSDYYNDAFVEYTYFLTKGLRFTYNF